MSQESTPNNVNPRTEGSVAPPDNLDDLQFGHAEVAPPVEVLEGVASDADGGVESGSRDMACGRCQNPIQDAYFTINGEVRCQACRDQEVAFRSGGMAGGRALRALVFGTIAGAVGAAIYYGILALTGYEIGLIAILVGFLVGFAVNIGSHHRGGWFYQLMAIGLTYLAIVSTYIPFAAEGLRGADVEAGTEMAGVFFWVVVVLVSLVSPFLAGLENILGLLIIGFGVYQAWSMNKRTSFDEEGPFHLGSAESIVPPVLDLPYPESSTPSALPGAS